MPLFKVPGIGSTGVVSDLSQQDLPPNTWTSAQNIRFYNGNVTNILQDIEALDGITKPDISVNHAQAMLGYFFTDDTIFYATDDQIWSYASGTHTDRSNTTTPTDVNTSNKWVSFIFSNSIVFSNPNSVPQIMIPGDTEFSSLPDWSTNWTCENMVPYKNFLVALNTTESGTEYKQRVRWSDAAGPNDAPLSWDATDPTKLAGFTDLTDARGEILTAATLQDVMYIYTSEEIFAMQYVGGNALFNFRKVNTDIGLLNQYCVAPYKNGHVIVSRDNVYAFNGTQAVSIIDSKIRDLFYTKLNLDFKDFIRVVQNPKFNEVWICFPNDTSVAGEMNEAAVWNSETGVWSFRTLGNLTSLCSVRKPIANSILWDSATYVWDSADAGEAWSSRDYGGNVLIGATNTGEFTLIDWSISSDTGTTSFIERRYIDLDDAGAQSTGVKSISSLYPQVGGVGSLYFRLGVSDYIGGPITWSDQKLFEIGTTNRVDFRLSGRYFSIQVTTNDNANQWFFSGYDIEFTPRFRGRRIS